MSEAITIMMSDVERPESWRPDDDLDGLAETLDGWATIADRLPSGRVELSSLTFRSWAARIREQRLRNAIPPDGRKPSDIVAEMRALVDRLGPEYDNALAGVTCRQVRDWIDRLDQTLEAGA